MTDTTPTASASDSAGFPQDRLRQSLLKKAGLTDAQIQEALQEERDGDQQLDQVLVEQSLRRRDVDGSDRCSRS